MKFKEIFYLLGIKPKIRTYNYIINEFNLPDYGIIQYAQWLHPGESKKEITIEVVNELKKYLKIGDLCIDIGAHTGDSTIPLALAVGKEGTVLALEPNEYVYKVLEKNSKLNTNLTSIVPMNVAAANKDSDLIFEYSDQGFCNGGFHEGISKWKHGHAFKLKVQGINLSNKLNNKFKSKLDRLKFIKVDTEGFDLTVLKSLIDIIDCYSPYVKAEVYKHTSLEYRKELFELFHSRNYSIYKIDTDKNLKGQKLTENDLMIWKHYDIFCSPKKLN